MENKPEPKPGYSLASELEKVEKIFEILGESSLAIRSFNISWSMDDPIILLKVEKFPSLAYKDEPNDS